MKTKNKMKLINACLGDEIGSIFFEALGEVKIEREIKKLKEENKNIDSLTPDEFKERYGKWTVYELKCLREKLKKEAVNV